MIIQRQWNRRKKITAVVCEDEFTDKQKSACKRCVLLSWQKYFMASSSGCAEINCSYNKYQPSTGKKIHIHDSQEVEFSICTACHCIALLYNHFFLSGLKYFMGFPIKMPKGRHRSEFRNTVFCPNYISFLNIPVCLTQSGRVASHSCTEYHWGSLNAFYNERFFRRS